MYEAWRNNRQAFEDYLGVQSKDRFPVGGLLAEFVVTEAHSCGLRACHEIPASHPMLATTAARNPRL